MAVEGLEQPLGGTTLDAEEPLDGSAVENRNRKLFEIAADFAGVGMPGRLGGHGMSLPQLVLFCRDCVI
jgi:hypothetical protein